MTADQAIFSAEQKHDDAIETMAKEMAMENIRVAQMNWALGVIQDAFMGEKK